MRELALLIFVSLDGVMQAPAEADEDRSDNFSHGGWAKPYWEPVMEQVKREAMAKPYDMLLGRKTFDLFAKAHASPTSHSSDGPMDVAMKYVVTSVAETLAWKNSIAISENIVDEIRKLKSADGPLLQVHGSWKLIQLLLDNNLVDEFRLWTFPVTLGEGKRLFSDGTRHNNLRLVKYEPTGNGAVMNIYRSD